MFIISVTEALEQLRFPSFFDSSERKAAYEKVMLWGTAEERESAQIAKLKYPFDELEELRSSDFSIASKEQHA